MKNKKLPLILIILTLFALVPLFVQNNYILHIFVLAFIWTIVVSAWDLITGYAGIFSFGQIAFFVIGAYTSGMVSIIYGVSPWVGMIAAGLITAFVGLLIALPCLRVKGVYISLVTYALHLVLPTFTSRGASLGTGGSGGLVEIPPLHLGSYVFAPMDKVAWYYAAFFISSLCLIAIYKIIKSPYGLALTALRDAEAFAQSLGINEYKNKLIVFAVSAFITGIAGSLYAHYVGSVSHRLLGMDFFLLIMIMLTIGGMGRFPGAAVGAFAITFLNELLRISGGYRLIILGGIVVVVIMIMPQGLIKFGETVYVYLTNLIERKRGNNKASL